MARKAVNSRNRGRPTSSNPASARVSVSLTPDVARTLQDIAQQKKVSLAWVMRDAAEKYIAEQWPLFAGNRSGGAQ
jgi:predicted transcriptional regulator